MLKSFSNIVSIVLLTVLLTSLLACSQVAVSPLGTTQISTTVNINKGWQFKRLDAEQVDAPWQLVNLPHTPKIEPLVVNEQWQGAAWYQKELMLDQKWKNNKVFIRFEGAMNHAEVWLNDKKVAEHLGGYLPFTIDLTDDINFEGENLLKVKLANIDNPTIGPKPLATLDFNTYGGLYRDVNLIIKNPLHITDEIHADKVASGGVFVTFPQINVAKSVVEVKTHISNEYADNKDFMLKQKLLFEGVLVAQTDDELITLTAGSDKQYSQQLTVNDAQLWSPKSPNLYQLVSEVYLDNELIEQKKTRIGLRQFAFNEQHQLLINGEVTLLRGVNRHQEYPHVGYATSHQADYRDAVKIKSAGFDYVRLSHYPHSKAFMDAADELGLVLLDAILGWQYYADTPEFQAQIQQTCRDLIRRDRNHASVLAWECSLNESAMPAAFVEQLKTIVHQEDSTRLSAGWLPEYDIYLQARQHRQKHYETPTKPYSVSEYGDWEYYAQNAGLNQDAWSDLKEEERTSRQLLNSGEARLLQQARNLQEAHNDNFKTPAFSDSYWVMFDYNRGYSDDLEASGIMSIHRLPKYSYYFYQSQRDASEYSPQFDSGPMVFIASEWQAKSSALVRVFSNADEVELWLNGQLISKNKPSQDKFSSHLSHAPFEFDMKSFKPGQLVAKAYINGDLVAMHQVTTPQSATSIKLTLDESGKEPAAGVNDVVFVYAELLDAQGNSVPVNGVNIDFEVQGDIEILHTSASLTEQGKAAVLIRIGQSLSGATIKATASGLKFESKTLSISSMAMAGN
ncbi:glycoside hydrolase family 2 protein [Colwellia piezophila]|uniref:glycoside hydrolase family 2 protein n=1 Tax=Colwellia piezophila TaxID=211668 RepID=UPI00036B343F|nr:glycoside hydrolase family 2 TIM barrel-domain containing protein [Colwellia piezophila]